MKFSVGSYRQVKLAHPARAELPNELIRTYVSANPGIRTVQFLKGVKPCSGRIEELRSHPFVRREQGLDFLAQFRIRGADFLDVARSQRGVELQRLIEGAHQLLPSHRVHGES